MAKPSRNPREARRMGYPAAGRPPAAGRDATGGRGKGRAGGGRRDGARRPDGARRSDGGRRPDGARRAGPDQPRISWPRRAGIVVALLVVGTSIVLAGGSLAPHGGAPDGSDDPAASVGGLVPPAPALAAPVESLVTSAATDIAGTVPATVPRESAYRLRVYVNDRLARERRLPPDESFTIRAVALDQGPNEIRAAIVGPTGESLHSAPIFIIRDDEPPTLRLGQPASGATVHAERVSVDGRTDPGAVIGVTNSATSEEVEVIGTADGRFEVTLSMAMGVNEIRLVARDEAGNRSRATLVLVREEGAAAVELRLSRDSISLHGLPTSISLTAYVTDDLGRPVDGADVTFSVSVPGQSTSTHRATSNSGVAVWRGVRLPREGTLSGQGFATVLAVLPGGRTLQGSATFSVR